MQSRHIPAGVTSRFKSVVLQHQRGRTGLLRMQLSGARHQRSLVTTQAIKLYTNPGSRGKMSEWYLEELSQSHSLKYETVNVDMRGGEHKTPAYLKINPFGKVPALLDEELPVFESGAILLHLANKYGKLTPDELGKAAKWVLFANSTFSEAFFVRGPSQSSAALLQVLEGILAKNTYITGDKFGVADVALAGYLLYLPMFFPDLDLSPYPNMFRYMQQTAERPACPGPYKEAMQAALARKNKAGGIFGRMMGR